MKDKDPNEEEFNKDEQDNINEADDSFGLPDLDFSTLDDEPEEESSEAAEPEVEATATEEAASEEPEAEEEVVEEEEPEEAPEEHSEFHEGTVLATGIQDEAHEDTEEETKEERTTYVPPKPESNAPRIIAMLVATLVVSGAIWYFMFYRPQKVAEENARQEQIDKDKAAAEAAAKKKAEEERLAAEKAAAEAADADEAASKVATFNTISTPTGRYYVVVASFIDVDMAKDLGNKMKADGVSTVLLAPKGNKKFNRLTLGDFGSWNEAQEQANKLKGQYGDALWVLKY